MKLSCFSAQSYDAQYLADAHSARFASKFDIAFHALPLSAETASLAKGSDAICVFVNDVVGAELLETLHGYGVRAILLRCAGYDNVDLDAAGKLRILVANVPAYSPEAVAEFAAAQIQTLNRKTHRAFNRTREGNFSLNGLLGFTLHGKTVGVVGTGRIGIAFTKILHGFGCRLVAYDPFPNKAFEQYGELTDFETLLKQSDIISLHCPLTPNTKHIINESSLSMMKRGAMLINTSRGGLIDTKAVLHSLKSKHLGGLAIDVYEKEGPLFYSDHSGDIIDDDILTRLMTFPNVLISGHQAFFTTESLQEIAEVTLSNMLDCIEGRECGNAVLGKAAKAQNQNAGPIRI